MKKYESESVIPDSPQAGVTNKPNLSTIGKISSRVRGLFADIKESVHAKTEFQHPYTMSISGRGLGSEDGMSVDPAPFMPSINGSPGTRGLNTMLPTLKGSLNPPSPVNGIKRHETFGRYVENSAVVKACGV